MAEPQLSDPATPGLPPVDPGTPSLPVNNSADIPDYTAVNQTLGAPKNSGMSLLDQIQAREDEIRKGGSADRSAARQIEAKQGREAGLADQVDQPSLGAPGLDAPLLRADMGLSNTFEDRKSKFLSSYPDGDMVEVKDPSSPHSLVQLFRRNASEPYAKVDADAFEKFEVLNDIADVSPDIATSVLEGVFMGGKKLWQQALIAFGGGAGVEITKDAIDALRGYQSQTVPQILAEAGERGLYNATGAITTAGISGPLNFLRGRGGFSVMKGAGEAMAAAERLGIPRLHAGQITSSPILRKIAGQSAQTSAFIGNYEKEQSAATVRALTSLRDEDVSGVLSGDLAKLDDQARTQVIAAVVANPSTLGKGGEAIQRGIAEYDDFSRMAVNKLYGDARNMEAPVFDPAPLQSVAVNLGAKAAALGRELPGGIQDAIGRIMRFDPNAPSTMLPDGTVIDATSQLRAIRTDLWDMKTVPPGAVLTPEQRETARQAGDLYYAINRVLDDPKNVAPEFRAAWAKASTEAKMRFDTMEKLIIVKAARSETPTQLADRLVNPLQVDNLQLLKGVIPDEQWGLFKDAAMSKLTAPENVNGLTKRLQSFDSATLNTLFSKEEQAALRDVGQKIDTFNALDIPGTLAENTRRGNIAYDLLMSKKEGQIDTFIDMLEKNSGPSGTPGMKQQVRAGLVDALISRNTATVGGIPTIKWENLSSDLDKLAANGGNRILEPSDMATLRDLRTVGDLMRATSDAGTSMQAASTAAEVGRFSPMALYRMVHATTIGAVVTSEWWQKRLLRDPNVKESSMAALRAFGSFLGGLAADVDPGSTSSAIKSNPRSGMSHGSGDDEIKGGAGDDTLGVSLKKKPEKVIVQPKAVQATVAEGLSQNEDFQNSLGGNPITRLGFDPKAISVATEADGFSDGGGSTMAGMHYPNEVEPATLRMLKEGEKAGRISGPGSSRTTDAIIAAGADYAEMEKTIRHESVHRGISLILGDEKGKRPELDVSPKVKLKEEDLVRIMDYIFIPDEKDTVEKYFKKQGLVVKDLATDNTVLKFLMKYAQVAQEQLGDNKTLLNPKGEK